MQFVCGGRWLGWPSDDQRSRTSSGNFAASTALRSQQAAASACGHGTAAAGRQRSSANVHTASDPRSIAGDLLQAAAAAAVLHAPRNPRQRAAAAAAAAAGRPASATPPVPAAGSAICSPGLDSALLQAVSYPAGTALSIQPSQGSCSGMWALVVWLGGLKAGVGFQGRDRPSCKRHWAALRPQLRAVVKLEQFVARDQPRRERARARFSWCLLGI